MKSQDSKNFPYKKRKEKARGNLVFFIEKKEKEGLSLSEEREKRGKEREEAHPLSRVQKR